MSDRYTQRGIDGTLCLSAICRTAFDTLVDMPPALVLGPERRRAVLGDLYAGVAYPPTLYGPNGQGSTEWSLK